MSTKRHHNFSKVLMDLVNDDKPVRDMTRDTPTARKTRNKLEILSHSSKSMVIEQQAKAISSAYSNMTAHN